MSNTILDVALVVVGALLIIGGLIALGIVMLVRHRRERRMRKRAEEAKRRTETPGLLALAATIEGVRLATDLVRVGKEVGRQGFAPAVAGSLRVLADFTESDRPALRRVVSSDGTVTLMFSDIEESTALNEALGDEGWIKLLKEHDAVIRKSVRQHRGQVVKTLGDSFMVAFKEVPPAVRCAIEIQQVLAEDHHEGDQLIRVRIGLHCGEVTRQGKDVLGLNVSLAARVAAEAEGGEILVSSAVKKLAQPGAPADAQDPVRFGRGRTVRLKGISEAETLYPVHW